MKKAVANPHVVVVSDWTRFKSWEYMKAQEDSGYTILYGPGFPLCFLQKLTKSVIAAWIASLSTEKVVYTAQERIFS